MEKNTNTIYDEYFCKNVGSILLKRLYDSNWEIKDSIIETIIPMVNVKSNSQYNFYLLFLRLTKFSFYRYSLV